LQEKESLEFAGQADPHKVEHRLHPNDDEIAEVEFEER
jgi:hypothetical protein